MNIRAYNRTAWDRQVENGNQWTVPVSPTQIAAARLGMWQVLLTPTKAVPRSWFPDDLKDCRLLCLACGGGQQAPLFAAAGAQVTVLDNSPRQLAQDRWVAERDSLKLTTVEGDMADLSMFDAEQFDLIFHPVSNCFVPHIQPVWNESFRVLKLGGALLSGFNNPVLYLFDQNLADQGVLEVRYALPYSDLDSLSEEDRQHHKDLSAPLEFSHSLEEQIGGQIAAGFSITGLYEDFDPGSVYARFMPTFIATRAIKP